MDSKVFDIFEKTYEEHGNFHQGGIQDQYDKLASHYEDVYLAAGWPDPQTVADMIKELIITDNSKILDMGCGSGLVGQYLKEYGIKNIDGVDGSPGMLEKAKEKEAYDTLEELFIGNPEEMPAKYIGIYDFSVSSGLLADGHAAPNILDVKLLTTKVGGYLMFTVREEYLTTLDYGKRIEELETEGKMELIKRVEFTKYQNMTDK